MVGGWILAQLCAAWTSNVGPTSCSLTIRRRAQKGLVPRDLGGNHWHVALGGNRGEDPGHAGVTMSLDCPWNTFKSSLESRRKCLGRVKYLNVSQKDSYCSLPQQKNFFQSLSSVHSCNQIQNTAKCVWMGGKQPVTFENCLNTPRSCAVKAWHCGK